MPLPTPGKPSAATAEALASEALVVAVAALAVAVTAAALAVTCDAAAAAANAAAPARRSQPVIIYCTGLGAVDIPVPVGAPAPANPLARVTGTVRVEIGGRQASILFAGLAPGFSGLYQINVFVPATSETGDAVEVLIDW